MKILVIHTKYKFSGGEDSVVSNEIEMLRSNALTVELLEFSNEGHSLIKLLQLPFNIFSYVRVKRKLKSFMPDIVHIHNLHFAASASVLYAIKNSRIPFVITLHNYRLLCPSAVLFHKGKLFLDSLSQGFPWNAIRHAVYNNSRLLTLWVSISQQLHKSSGSWQMCSRYIALTDHAEKLFLESDLKIQKDRIIVKPNFYPDPGLRVQEEKGFFLYVGRLSEEKGIRVLLNAFSLCKYNLKIAGDGPLREEVVSFSRSMGYVQYLGLQNKDQINLLMNTCTALVFPSVWFEGMPLTIIEALACGAPVIATRLGAMQSMITEGYNGLFFESENHADLVEKLEMFQQFQPAVKLSYRTHARLTYEENYTPEKNYKQLISIYNDVK